MTFATDARLGQAVVVPFRNELAGFDDLVTEARELWHAEQSNDAPVSSRISSKWGCVGIRIRDEVLALNWTRAWADHFREGAMPIPPVDDDGAIDISWPLTLDHAGLDLDLILATATKPENKRPSPQAIADAWVDLGYEEYFFENVRHGIRTPDDSLIWQRIQEREPHWLSGDAYSKAIKLLSAES